MTSMVIFPLFSNNPDKTVNEWLFQECSFTGRKSETGWLKQGFIINVGKITYSTKSNDFSDIKKKQKEQK